MVLTETGPHTPAGELLRRCWHPVAVSEQLTDENPILSLRVLSENLVLYRNRSGQVGLMQERCTHHGVLLHRGGTVGEDCLICPLHGWRFDVDGNCFVLAYQGKIYPIEWARARTYAVQERAGLYWAYLGRTPMPALPAFDALDGPVRLTVYPALEEHWLHGADTARSGRHAARLRLPIDDTHTWQVAIDVAPSSASPPSAPPAPEILYLQSASGWAEPPLGSPPSSFAPLWRKLTTLEITGADLLSLRDLIRAQKNGHAHDPSPEILYPYHQIVASEID